MIQYVEEPGCSGAVTYAHVGQRACRIMPNGLLEIAPQAGAGEHGSNVTYYSAARMVSSDPPC